MTHLTLLAGPEIEKAKRYIDDVVNKKRLCGKLERLAVERHLKLYSKPEYYFDEIAADWTLFIFTLLKHTSGEYYKRPFCLEPWQAFSIYCTFGWKIKATGKRLIKKSYIRTAKKNGKTELAAGIGVYGYKFDGENVAEVYSAANKLDQAVICWNAAATMVKLLKEDSKKFARGLKLYDSKNYKEIKDLSDGSFFRPLASESKTQDGIRTHIGIIDEYHAAINSDLLDNIQSSMVGREQPLLYVITTSGFNINGPCHNYEQSLLPILTGDEENDSVFALIFSLDEEDLEENKLNKLPAWYEKSLWEKTNPSIGRTPKWENIENEFREAVQLGGQKMTSFKTKNMNIWVNQSTTWITPEIWNKGRREIREEDLIGRECFVAIDLSVRWDLAGFGLLFPPSEKYNSEEFTFLPFFFCPEDGAKERDKVNRVPYLKFSEQGFLELTPGPVVDQSIIKTKLLECSKKFNFKRVVYDAYQSTNLATELTKDLENGPELVHVFGQVATNFNEPVLDIEAHLGLGNINHGGNPVLQWMAGNVAIYTNATGLRMFNRGASKEKIDGMVILAMCFGAMRDFYKLEGMPFPYGEGRGVRSVSHQIVKI